MKKPFYYFIGVIIIALALFLLITMKTKLTDVEVKVKIVDEFNDNNDVKTIRVCVLNKYNNYELVNVVIKDNIDPSLFIFEIYNIKRNALPIGYEVISNYVLEVINYQKDGNILNFELKDSPIPEEEIIKTLYVMMISYKYINIYEVNLKIGNKNYQSKNYFVLK